MLNLSRLPLRALAAASSAALPALALLSTGAPAGAQTPAPTRAWGGETRQVFTLDVSGNRHVWNVGDGPLIRHAINPGAGVSWTAQSPPSDVTQNLLDVEFIPNPATGGLTHLGFAVGLNGHVLESPDYGTTWVHLDSGEVQNQLSPSENATLWRGRFLSETDGFVCGLWTFKRWDGTNWNAVNLLNQFGLPMSADSIEFYALELVVDPAHPNRWIGLAAGQVWGGPGGSGHADSGIVFRGSFAVNGGNTWTEVFRTVSGTGTKYEDPWDLEFEPNPSTFGNAVVYLCGGTGTSDGAVFRSTDGGQTWSSTPDLANTTTLYGLSTLSPTDAVAVGYGGQIWVRNASGWTCRRGVTCTLPTGVTETQTAPLAGAHGVLPDSYVSGSFGYLHMSSNGFASASVDLDPSSSQANSEHWRFVDMDFTTSLTGYAVAANKTIIESVDGGRHWTLSPSSPNTLVGGPDQGPMRGVSFRVGGGSGVAVGYGNVGTLAPFTTPTVLESFAYYKHETSLTSWTPSQLAFSPGRAWLDVEDVAWAAGDNSTAEFWAVGRAGDGTSPYGLTNRIPALLRSTDGGATWVDGNALTGGLIPSTVHLNAIAFRSSTEGFAVGWDDALGTSVAYRIGLTGGTPTLTPISVTSGASNEMFDVTGNTSFVAACGERSSVWVYNPSVPSFSLTTVPSLGHANPPDFLSIGAPPGSALNVLVGARTSIDEVDSPGLGKMLYFTGSAWTAIPAATDKSVLSLGLRSFGGWAIGGAAGVSGSSEVGMVADTAVLRW